MSYSYDPTGFLIQGKSVKLSNNVSMVCPTISDIMDNKDFDKYGTVFTLETRELFATSREVDQIESQFPNLWAMIWDNQMSKMMGDMLDADRNSDEMRSLREILIDAICFWSGLEKDIVDESGDQAGMIVLENQKKLLHVQSQWIIDEKEYINFGNVIKTIINWNKNEDVPPRPMTDAKYESWMAFYEGITAKAKRRPKMHWGDKMLLLSTSTESLIPLKTISDMTVYGFYETLKFLNLKEANEISWRVFTMPDIDRSKIKFPGYWKDSAKLTVVK